MTRKLCIQFAPDHDTKHFANFLYSICTISHFNIFKFNSLPVLEHGRSVFSPPNENSWFGYTEIGSAPCFHHSWQRSIHNFRLLLTHTNTGESLTSSQSSCRIQTLKSSHILKRSCTLLWCFVFVYINKFTSNFLQSVNEFMLSNWRCNRY